MQISVDETDGFIFHFSPILGVKLRLEEPPGATSTGVLDHEFSRLDTSLSPSANTCDVSIKCSLTAHTLCPLV
jgi:hypothetical protein